MIELTDEEVSLLGVMIGSFRNVGFDEFQEKSNLDSYVNEKLEFLPMDAEEFKSITS